MASIESAICIIRETSHMAGYITATYPAPDIRFTKAVADLLTRNPNGASGFTTVGNKRHINIVVLFQPYYVLQ